MAENEKWLTITHTSFHMIRVMMDVKSDFDRVVFNQQSSQMEIYNFSRTLCWSSNVKIEFILFFQMHAIYKLRKYILNHLIR